MEKQSKISPSNLSKTSQESRQSLKSNQNEGRSTITLSDKDARRAGEFSGCSIKEAGSSILLGSCDSLMSREIRPAKIVDVHGVRVRPAVVRFTNTFENQSYTETVSVQNISSTSVTVRIHNPRAWSFRLTSLDRGHQLAPGLTISRRLHYTCTKGGIVQSTLPIYINDNLFELPLEAYKGQAFVEIVPTTIKFGRVDIGCKPVERKILIKNISFCATKFIVDVGSNELDLHVGPMKGWIRPYSSISITLQLLALREGSHSSELWITTDLSQTRVQVEVEACRRSLMVLHPNAITDFTLVDFPVTFYGCRRYQTVMVYNMAASSSAFVVLADFGSKGQMPFREAKEISEHNVKMFNVEPVEGRIRPFEERIFTFWFNPQILKGSDKIGSKNDSNEDLNDYLCAIRIKRIQVDDFGTDSTGLRINPDSLRNIATVNPRSDQSNTSLDKDIDKEKYKEKLQTNKPLLEDISVLLYLYGEAEIPFLSVTPDTLHFPNIPVGSNVTKVIHMTNSTTHMLAFQYSKIPFFEVLPDFKKIAPKSSCDVTVKLSARNIGTLKKNVIFEVLAQENATDKQDFQVVSQVTVRIVGEVKSLKPVLEPRFNPGITPLKTHEVGFLTDDITFASKIEKPRCAMLSAALQGRPWHRSEAVIAFPNDRPLTLRSRPTDSTAKMLLYTILEFVRYAHSPFHHQTFPWH